MNITHLFHTNNATLTNTEINTTNGSVSYSTYETKNSFTQCAIWFPNNTSLLDIVDADDNAITNIWDLVKNN